MRQTSRSAGNGGFTLMELLLAAVAGALILSSVYIVFGRAVHLRNNAVERTREARLRQRAVDVIRTDLQNALVSGGTLAATLQGSPQAPASQLPGYLRFTTTTARTQEDVALSDIQEVEYYLVADESSTTRRSGVLLRALNQNLLADVPEVAREERLLEGLESMEVEFYDGSTWIDTWEVTEEDNAVPKAIRVRLISAAITDGSVKSPIEVVVPWSTVPEKITTTAETDPDAAPPAGTPPPTTP